MLTSVLFVRKIKQMPQNIKSKGEFRPWKNVPLKDAIDWLEKLLTSDEVFCHRNCYPEFTHQNQIKTFEARAEGQKADVELPK